jgi:arylsulfatase
MFGHRAIDHDGWRAVCPWPGPSFAEAGRPFGTPITAGDLTDLDAHHWELYHIAADVAENHDLAAEHRDKLIEMIAMWYVETGKYNVLPIDGSAVARVTVERPQVAAPRDRYIYRPDTQTVPYFAEPKLLNRTHSITADADPGRRRRGRPDLPGLRRGWLVLLRQGRQAALRPQLCPPCPVHRVLAGSPAYRAAPALVRVRAHRQARPAQRQGHPGRVQL